MSFSPKLFSYGRNVRVDEIPADLGFAAFGSRIVELRELLQHGKDVVSETQSYLLAP